jgi:hypothetical protein
VPTPAELTAIQQLLQQVYAARGWSTHPYQLATAWQQLEVAAVQEGGWDPMFEPQQLTAEGVAALGRLIDTTFFAGRLHSHYLVSRTHAGLTYKVVAAQGREDDHMALYHVASHAIHVNPGRWDKPLGPQRPMDCEGVVCTNRLQLLAHTLAHELVHALVAARWPDMDAASPAYRVDGCHGPLFHLLNARLYGHTSTALTWLPPRR